MNMGKKSLLNAMAALLQMLMTSVIGLVLSKTILSMYGSDYNGINSTVSQIISILMILEGGFSLTSNVALFNPFGRKDVEGMNAILSATRKRFLAVGGIALVLGIMITCIYPFTVSSTMPKWMIALLMLTALIPLCYNLAFNMKYRVLLLTDQKEYIISLATTITYILGNGIAIILMRLGFSILLARISIMTFLLINYFIIRAYCTKKYPFAYFKSKPNFSAIKGTKSVIALKVTSVIYSAVPIVAISTIPDKGTLLASVYAVYRSIIAVVRDSLTSVINAPRLAFGALFAEGNDKEIRRLFNQYELISCIGISTIVGTTCLLLMPFIELYTRGVDDIPYKDTFLAIVMLATVILEILHIPSGQIIQMKGEFTVARKIQTFACTMLVITMAVGRAVCGLYGVAVAVLIAAMLLAVMEIGYVSRRILNRSIFSVLKNMLPCTLICIVAGLVGHKGIIVLDSYYLFIVVGFLSLLCFGIVSLLVYYVIDRKSVKAVCLLLIKIVFKNRG